MISSSSSAVVNRPLKKSSAAMRRLLVMMVAPSPRQRGRIVGVRIVVGDRAADRAAMAHRRIADQAGEMRERRDVLLARPPRSRPRHAASWRRWRASGPGISMPVSPSTLRQVDECFGPARRSFMVGISVWPPARSFASSCLPSRLAACRTVAGRCYLNAYIVMLRILVFNSPWESASASCLRLVDLLQRLPHRLGGRGHRQFFGADGIGQRVDHRGRRRDRARLAAALDAERVGRRLGGGHVDLEHRQVIARAACSSP